MEEIDESSGSWPHASHIGQVGVCLLDVHSPLEALLVGAAAVLDSRINDWDVPVFLQYLVHAIEGELVFVDGEVFVVYHVVDVRPDSVQGNPVVFVALHHCLQSRNVLIAPPTLMEPKAPERRNRSSPAVQIDSFHSGFWTLLSQEEPEVEYSSDDFEGEEVLVVFGGLDNIHGVGAPQVVDVEEVVPFSEQVEGEVSIGLVALPFVNHLSPVPIEDSPLPVLLPEALLEAFSQSIHIFAVYFCGDFEVVVAEDELLIVGGEESGPILLTDDSEVEGRLGVLEGVACCVEREGEVGLWIDGEDACLRHLESLLAGVSDLEGEVEEGLCVEVEGKGLDDGAALLDVVAVRPRVVESQCDRGGVAHCAHHLVVELGSDAAHHRQQQKPGKKVASLFHSDIQQNNAQQQIFINWLLCIQNEWMRTMEGDHVDELRAKLL